MYLILVIFIILLFNKILSYRNYFLSPILLYFYYVFQSLVYVVLIILNGNFEIFNPKYDIYIDDVIYQILFSFIIIGISIIFIINIFGNSFKTGSFKSKLNRFANVKTCKITSVFGYLNLIVLFVIFYSQGNNYISNLLRNFLIFSPLLFGFNIRKLGLKVKVTWILYIVINFLYFTLLGARGYAIYPILFAFFGHFLYKVFVLSQVRKSFLQIGLMLFIFISYLNVVEIYRNTYGRDRITSGSIDQITSIKTDGNSNSSAIYRLVNNPMLAIVFLTNSQKEFRGITHILPELINSFSFVGGDNNLKYEARKHLSDATYGSRVANNYGYNNRYSSNVEFNVFSDAYSIYGNLGVFIYFSILTILILFFEKLSFNLIKKIGGYGVYINIYVTLGSFLFLYATSIIPFIRTLIINILTFSIIFYFLNLKKYKK